MNNCTTTTRPRLRYVDIAKGFGIVLVVLSHTEAFCIMTPLMGLFVPIFYFCAGYTYNHTNNYSLKYIIQRRASLLLKPYLFFTTLLFIFFNHFSVRELVGIVYSRFCLFPIDHENNIRFLTAGNAPLWFLTSFFVTYLLFYFLINHKNKYLMIFFYLLITILLKYCPILLPWSIDTSFLTALIMYCGKLYRESNYNLTSKTFQYIILAIIYASTRFINGDINISIRIYGVSVLLYYIMSISGCIVILYISKSIENTFIGNTLSKLGTHSLAIFCLEFIFISIANSLWGALPCQYYILKGLFGTIFALLGGYVVSLLLKKYKITKFLIT